MGEARLFRSKMNGSQRQRMKRKARHFLSLLISNKETAKNAANTAHGVLEREAASLKNETLEAAHGTHELLQPVKQAARN